MPAAPPPPPRDEPWLLRPLARRCWQVLLLGLALAVAVLAFSPDPPPAADTGWDKANHALAFTALGLSAELAFWPLRARRWRNALGLLAYGGLIELVQTRIPGRSGETADLLADAVGVVLGLLLATAAVAWLGRRRR